VKIVSHCWADSSYLTPGGDEVDYKQLQIVNKEGNIFILKGYWKYPEDWDPDERKGDGPAFVEEWHKLEIPTLPN
jgi:hypothetical protein